MKRRQPEIWNPQEPQTAPLQFSQASLRNRKNRLQLLSLADMEGMTEADLKRDLKEMTYIIAAQVQETLVNPSGVTKIASRIVGAMWGVEMMLGKRPLPDVLEIEAIFSDHRYRSPVQTWMFQQLQQALHPHGWQRLAITTPVHDDSHFGVALAQLQGFRLADIRGDSRIWEWEPEEENE